MGRRARAGPFDTEVAIVGAGVGGIATAVKLRRAGIEDFVVFEKSAGPGGTWFDNTYPGCAVDVLSQVYSFSFMPYDWSTTHAYQPELRQYVEDTIDHFGIRDHFRFSTAVEEASWDEQLRGYRIALAGGETCTARMLVSCVGFLNVPRYPDWPGLEEFSGPKFHSARWEHEHDLTGKTVGLVGTGSTAVQIAPALARQAGHLYIFQREPGWIIPKRVRTYRDSTRRRRRRWPWTQRVERVFAWLTFDLALRNAFMAGSVRNRLLRRLGLWHINSHVADPALRRALTPTHPFGCKRPVIDDDYLPALNRDNVTLIPHAVEALTEDAVITSDGARHAVDAVVMATGFHAQRYLSTLRIGGAAGRDLHHVWGREPRALLGITVPDFPNFAILYGPNTNGGNSIIFFLECQADAVVRMARRIARSRTGVIDTHPEAFWRFARWVDRENAHRFSATGFCRNYFAAADGRVATQWPRGGADFWLMSRVLPRFALTTRTRPQGIPTPVMRVAMKLFANWFVSPGVSWPQSRARMEAGLRLITPPRGTQVRRIELAGVPTEELLPAGAHGERVLLYLHGGGYATGSARAYRGPAAIVAAAFGARAIVPDYRLAPEHPHPQGLDDAIAVWDDLIERQGVDPTQIAVAGDSAGGGLALALAIALRDERRALPGVLGLVSPWLDMSEAGFDALPDAPSDVLPQNTLRRFADEYLCGGANGRDPLVSPLLADLRGLPPIVLHTSRDELLAQQGRDLAARARAANVPIEHEELSGAWHAIHVTAPMLGPPHKDAPERLGVQLARTIGAAHNVAAIA